MQLKVLKLPLSFIHSMLCLFYASILAEWNIFTNVLTQSFTPMVLKCWLPYFSIDKGYLQRKYEKVLPENPLGSKHSPPCPHCVIQP